jgi:hypothetical protein
MFNKVIEAGKFRFLDRSNGFYAPGKEYYITVYRGLFGRIKVQCLHGFYHMPYAGSTVRYRSYAQFVKSWKYLTQRQQGGESGAQA